MKKASLTKLKTSTRISKRWCLGLLGHPMAKMSKINLAILVTNSRSWLMKLTIAILDHYQVAHQSRDSQVLTCHLTASKHRRFRPKGAPVQRERVPWHKCNSSSGQDYWTYKLRQQKQKHRRTKWIATRAAWRAPSSTHRATTLKTTTPLRNSCNSV